MKTRLILIAEVETHGDETPQQRLDAFREAARPGHWGVTLYRAELGAEGLELFDSLSKVVEVEVHP